MAGQQIPDPQTLSSWEDAFQHPLPVVRKLEQQLRKNIDDNRQKLRSLVGASYRDLLGTADRIIDMDNQIQEVETHMADIGRKCNARTVESIGENHKKLELERGREERLRLARLAQTKVLQSAIAVAGRLVKTNGDALLAAKLLILARLLHKTLSEHREPPALLENLRRKLAQSRKRLLAYISRSLARSEVGKETTAHTLCAYSLISTVAPRNVLRHFLQTRFEQLEVFAENPSEVTLMAMLNLYSRTLLDSRELFPRRFADTLSQISQGTLVGDQDLCSVTELGLDMYGRWIADDVRNFYIWARHDQLATSDVTDALASWSRQAQGCLLQALQVALKDQTDTWAVLTLRQKVLTKYLSLSPKLGSEVHFQAMNDIRATFLDRLEDLANQAATIANLVLNAQSLESSSQSPSIWNLALEPTDLSGGAVPFRRAVLQRQHGRTDGISEITEILDAWLAKLHAYTEAISSMRTMKWHLDPDGDFDDLAQDEPLQVILGKQDPQHLEQKLSRATAASLQKVYSAMEKRLASDSDPAILIRLVREIDRRRRGLADSFEEAKSIHASPEFIAGLQEAIAVRVSHDALVSYTTRIKRASHALITLWGGSSPLPVQPSPAAFGFLKSLQGQMSRAGNDLWSPAAVLALKTHNADKLGVDVVLEEIDQSAGVALSHGHSEASESEDLAEGEARRAREGPRSRCGAALRNRYIELMFDILYLQRVLMGEVKSGLNELVDKLQERAELDATSTERLRKNASEYWKRTYLLFGLFANGQAS